MKTIVNYLRAFWALAHIFAKGATWHDYQIYRETLKKVNKWQITI